MYVVMDIKLFVLLTSCAISARADTQCIAQKGTCQEDNTYCAGSYVSGLCNGHSTRKCCLLPTDPDSKCLAQHGTCQEEQLRCSGNYVSDLCSGHASRKCCLSHTGNTDLDCTSGSRRYSATGTAYYPDSSTLEGGYSDMHGHPLQTLQDFLDGRSSVVVVAMDNHAGISYDTPVCIPELNHKYGLVIDFRVRDTGGAFFHKGYSRIDICVRHRADSYNSAINGPLTLVFQ